MAKYIYCRISTSAQSSESLEVQEAVCRKQIGQTSENIIIVRDIGSGKDTEQRPNFMAMMSALKPRDQVYVYDLSRLSRDAQQALFFFNEIAARGAELYSDGKLYQPANPIDKMLFTVTSGFSEMQRTLQLQKSREGTKKRAIEGNRIFAGDLFGYELVKKNGITQVNIIEEEAKLIRYVFTEYAKGRSLHDLERELYKAPTTRPFNFNINNLRYMIQRPIYFGKYLTVTNMQRHIMKYSRDEVEKALVKSNYYPPIISEDLFWNCFVNYKTCCAPHAVDYRNRWTKHDLSGVYKCFECGGGLTFHLRKRPELNNTPVYPQYIAQKHFPTCKTKNYSIYRADWLENITAFCFYLTFLCGGEIGKFFEEEKSALYESTKDLREALEKVINNIKSVDNKIERLVDAVAEGLLDKDSVKVKMEGLNKEKTELLEKQKDLTGQINSKGTEADILLEMSAQQIIDTFDNNRRKYYLKFVKEGLDFHNRLELEFVNGKRFIIHRPKRNNFRIFPSETEVYFRGIKQFSFTFDSMQATFSLSEVCSVEEVRKYAERDYSELLDKAKTLLSGGTVLI